ncbi:phage tail protein [Citrobacter freundii]|uniref:phage tail protein n=1 Tax=Citrobacter freundii TaxID=546 RepID=UPI0012AA267B|nr:phage tail protein [Citrobacter freundii]QGJ42092.1 phage tail protein [Citrobacter freundii]QGJ48848.1 phage tail protein [Citrobacter freundii]QGJ51602.1 phage tail protein [Citrobacter freundii]
MKDFKYFTSYLPDGDRLLELMQHFYPEQEFQNEIDSRVFGGIQFLQSAAGEDWYLSLVQFETETVKIQYNESGIVTAMTNDSSGLWPYECSVVELPVNAVPENARADGKWQYHEGVISPVAE